MMLYAINYDLKKDQGKDYNDLYEVIKSVGVWWHYLESTWIVETDKNSEEIWKIIEKIKDKEDHFLIIKLENEKQGWLPKKAWEWLNKNF